MTSQLRQTVIDVVMAHALVQGRYSEQAEEVGQPVEAAQYWQAYQAIKAVAENLRHHACWSEAEQAALHQTHYYYCANCGHSDAVETFGK